LLLINIAIKTNPTDNFETRLTYFIGWVLKKNQILKSFIFLNWDT
jgi:hypothetical protein